MFISDLECSDCNGYGLHREQRYSGEAPENCPTCKGTGIDPKFIVLEKRDPDKCLPPDQGWSLACTLEKRPQFQPRTPQDYVEWFPNQMVIDRAESIEWWAEWPEDA